MISTLAIYNYRSLRLLVDIAQGRIIPSLAREGGLQSTLWAGPEGFALGETRIAGTDRLDRPRWQWPSR